MIQKFLRNKTVGYYIAAFVAVLALVTLIVFFAGYNKPDITTVMGNKAESFVPVTIGIFLVAGFVIQLVVLAVPEFRLFQFAAIIMFGLALYKDILIIADFIAGIANNGVMYNGGDVNFNMFIFIAILVTVIAAIVTTFMGLTKEVKENDDEEESNEEEELANE